MIRNLFSIEEVTVWALNNTSSEAWLRDYTGQKGITYPFVFDASSEVFTSYQSGIQFGNIPPSYIIIDQEGTVRYRIDNQYNRFMEMKNFIETLLSSSAMEAGK